MELSLEIIVQEGLEFRTIQEWSEHLKVSRMSIHNWISNNYIDFVDIRGRKHVVLTNDSREFKGRRNGND